MMTRQLSPVHHFTATLAELGVSESEALVQALDIDEHLEQIDGLTSLAAGQRQPIGNLLRSAKRVTSEQMLEVLDEQRHSKRKVGEILVERDLLSPAERELVLAFQRRQIQKVKKPSKLSLGRVLVATGTINHDQLQEGLQLQARHGCRLGDALVAAGHVSEHHVQHGLHLQHKLLAAVLVTAMTVLSSLAPAPVQAASQMASLQVSAVIRNSAHLRTDFQATQLQITEADIARGYVDMPNASRFSVVTPKGGSYFVDFHPRSDLFQAVHIEGLGSQVQLGADGGSVTQAGAGLAGVSSTLNYRFELKPEIQPGVYDWPLQLAVRAR
jgi:hypothetical protein